MAMFAFLPIVLFFVWVTLDLGRRHRAAQAAGLLLGIASALSCVIATVLMRFEANSYCNGAAHTLLTESVEQLRLGNTDRVLRAWSLANERIDGGVYEFREDFAGVVEDAVADMAR